MQTSNQAPVQRCLPSGEEFAQPETTTSEQVKSKDLLKGQKAVNIEHNGSVYRLQTTKLGKLILTK